MIGKTVTTEHHLRGKAKVQDPIGMCSYSIDCHTVSYFVTEDGTIGREGGLMVGASPYAISYGSIVPVEGECENLIVPTALSASHVAYASIRMEPSFMILAQSAGTAAVMAADAGIPVQAVSYPDRAVTVIEGTLDAEMAKKHKATLFKMWVDSETGILLKLEETNANGEFVSGVEVASITFNQAVSRSKFSTETPAGFADIRAR